MLMRVAGLLLGSWSVVSGDYEGEGLCGVVDQDEFVELQVNSTPVVERGWTEVLEPVDAVGGSQRSVERRFQARADVVGQFGVLFGPGAKLCVFGVGVGRSECVRGDPFSPVWAVSGGILAGIASGVVVAIAFVLDEQREYGPVVGVDWQPEQLDIDPLVRAVIEVDEDLAQVGEPVRSLAALTMAGNINAPGSCNTSLRGKVKNRLNSDLPISWNTHSCSNWASVNTCVANADLRTDEHDRPPGQQG